MSQILIHFCKLRKKKDTYLLFHKIESKVCVYLSQHTLYNIEPRTISAVMDLHYFAFMIMYNP